MAKRRNITGTPLLVASAGFFLQLGCSGGRSKPPEVTGNLMPPPMVSATVCVDTEPESATVQLNGMIAEERCREVRSDGSVTLEVSAPGYSPSQQLFEIVEGEKKELKVTLEPALEPPDMPMGNLMPPPMDEPLEPEKKE